MVRSVVLLSLVAAALSLTSTALAGTGGSGTTGTTGAGGSTTGTTGAGAGSSADCNVAQEETSGTTCQECDPTAGCGDSTYHLVCQSSSTKAVFCNGPVRDTPSDQNVACSVTSAGLGGGHGGLPGAFVACGALVAAAALRFRRNRGGR